MKLSNLSNCQGVMEGCRRCRTLLCTSATEGRLQFFMNCVKTTDESDAFCRFSLLPLPPSIPLVYTFHLSYFTSSISPNLSLHFSHPPNSPSLQSPSLAILLPSTSAALFSTSPLPSSSSPHQFHSSIHFSLIDVLQARLKGKSYIYIFLTQRIPFQPHSFSFMPRYITFQALFTLTTHVFLRWLTN